MAPGSSFPAGLPRRRLAALLLALVAGGCGDDAPPAQRRDRFGVPGIVLVCMDTLRADARASMPVLDEFARGSTVFADASSQSSWTAPSIASLLTGLEPAHTGVRGPFAADPLVGSVTTVAEVLHDAGFVTAAFTAGGWVSAEKGFAQGFAGFSTAFDQRGPQVVLAEWQSHRRKDQPFFLFLHSYAAHDPYGPKGLTEPAGNVPGVAERARAIWRDAAAAGWRLAPEAAAWVFEQYLLDRAARETIGSAIGNDASARLWDLCVEWLDSDGAGSPERLALAARAKEAYLRGLEYADVMISRILSSLRRFDLPQGTVIAIVGDHGEGLGEHGTLSHGRWLYDELVRVPLYIRAPGRLPVGAVVRGSCALVDIMPTLLDLAGVRPPAGLDGRSLLPLANGKETGHPAYAEENRRVHGEAVQRSVRVVSMRTEAAKILLTYDLRTLALERTELYDLVADPGEASSLPESEEERFGPAFCLAAARLRASIPGLAPSPPCR